MASKKRRSQRLAQKTDSVQVAASAARQYSELSKSTTERQTNKATSRMLTVLSIFARDKAMWGVSDLSRKLGMTKNMVHRSVTTLCDEGLLARHEATSQYRLAPGVLELLGPGTGEPDFRSLAMPYAYRLRDATSETVLVSLRSRDFQVIIDGVEGRGDRVHRVRIGSCIPLHASAASRAILAALSDDEVQQYIERHAPLQRFTPNTLTEPRALWEEVHRVRARGFALGFEDYSTGSMSVSFSVVDTFQHPFGAITVGAPRLRLSSDQAIQIFQDNLDLVDEIRREARLFVSQ